MFKQPPQLHIKQQEKLGTNHQFNFNSLRDLQKNTNEKRTSKQNFQSIFDNIITLLKELRVRQQQIQSYVQNEIIDMNQKLDQASKQLLLAIEQYQQGEKEENHLESTLNSSKQHFFNQQSQNPTNNKEIIQIKLQQQDSHSISSSSSKFFINKNVIENSQINQSSQSLMKPNLMQIYTKSKHGDFFDQITNINKQTQNPISEKTQNKNSNVGFLHNLINSQKPKDTAIKNKTNITEENQDNSLLKTQYANQSSCYYCGKAFDSEFILTPCYHNYHDPCLREHYELLLKEYKNQKQIVCMCKMKLPQLFISRSLKVNLESLLQKQVEVIKEKIKSQIDWCVKCKFFWIRRMSDTYTRQCKMCDQNGVIIIKSK
ncbi:unnamed protein product (macronuclear) [Paramecium tetraurelia]|uniref:RING-type domain-containing protein n=1 Tax=Paramecium tetraurelia TaxID=5888 RepID=A0DNI6_PARTE|nr:uncharacterized protein GSPATT00018799001 [Paramecium tetraurelia]CAK84603.1 unnamed protein product [Paramecium tetraurelia]|eukprot:XP_001452000.1 hypothetical protein (macronuclear) [Paramecium tetraurelia strain d4-2]